MRTAHARSDAEMPPPQRPRTPAARPRTRRASGRVLAPAAEQGATLSIAEVSGLTGVSSSTLRDWEALGIVKPERIGNRRRYTEFDLTRVRTAHALRAQNFNPNAIVAMLGALPSTLSGHEPSDGATVTGRHLREARLHAAMTLRQVANQVGISVSHLSSIERGGSRPSLAVLQRLANAYRIQVADLFGSHPATQGPVLTRPDAQEALVSDHGRVRVRALARGRALCSDLYEADPGGSSGGAYSHTGEEYVYVLSGVVELWLDERRRYRLSAGEALFFPSDLPHRWASVGPDKLVMMWTNAEVSSSPLGAWVRGATDAHGNGSHL